MTEFLFIKKVVLTRKFFPIDTFFMFFRQNMKKIVRKGNLNSKKICIDRADRAGDIVI